MFFLDVNPLDHAPEADHVVGEEIAPGVVIERRTILRLGLLGLGGMALSPLLGGCRSSDPTTGAAAPLSFDQLVAALRPQAKAIIQTPVPDEEAYLAQVARLMLRLDRQGDPAKGGHPVEFTSRLEERPLVIYQIKMAPGTRIPLHDHRHYNGVLMGLDGACRCRYFDIVPPAPGEAPVDADGMPAAGSDFKIRQTMDCQLKPGATGHLSRTRNNLHELVAGPDGARMLDVFTFFRQDGTSHWLDWKGQQRDGQGNYTVRWA